MHRTCRKVITKRSTSLILKFGMLVEHYASYHPLDFGDQVTVFVVDDVVVIVIVDVVTPILVIMREIDLSQISYCY